MRSAECFLAFCGLTATVAEGGAMNWCRETGGCDGDVYVWDEAAIEHVSF
jgi:hypothetical protein